MTNRFEIASPRDGSLEKLKNQQVWHPFDMRAKAFVQELSDAILKEKEFRRFPELMAMAFWMRRAGVARLEKDFLNRRGERLWLGRGLVFHIAPSNVDTIFMYSWLLSMLVGNLNIVRISGRSNSQIETLLELINDVAAQKKFAELRGRFLVVRYEHDDETTRLFSSLCQLRVIWGGDETIQRIRAVPIPPMTTEMTFADKFSMTLISAAELLVQEKLDTLLTGFYNDAFWFDQNACSSSRLIVWIGNGKKVLQARRKFWQLVETKVTEKQFEFSPAIVMNKLLAENSLAIEAEGRIIVEKTANSLVNRVWLENPADIRRELHCGGGLFFEMRLNKLDDLARLVAPKDQTVTVFGFEREELSAFVSKHRPVGINRFVPVGQAMEFSPIWDGYDLLREFCREVDITIRR